MTLPRFHALQAEWKKAPPVHVSLAAYLGIYKPDGEPGEDEPAGDLLSSFEKCFNPLPPKGEDHNLT